MNKLYFKGARAALIVYDISDRRSFEKAQKWNTDLDNETQDRLEGQDILKFLVGNKCDLVDQQQVTTKDGEMEAGRMGAVFFEVSAKENT